MSSTADVDLARDPSLGASLREDVLEPGLAILDPHVHIIDAYGIRYLTPEYLRDAGDGHKVVGCVYVEASDHYRTSGPEHLKSLGEVEYVVDLHRRTRGGPTWIGKGLVSYVDLRQDPALVAEALDAQMQAAGKVLKGVRDFAAWDDSGAVWTRDKEAGPKVYSRPDFRAGFAELGKRGLSFDAWVYYHQLPTIAGLAGDFPDTPIVVDHTGSVLGVGPYAGREKEIFETWRGHIHELARHPNVWMKLGGLGMEIMGDDYEHRSVPVSSEELAAAWKPYFETCIEAFGPRRCMFESNFPIDSRVCSYRTLWNVFKRVAAGASDAEKALLFHDTANSFYRLDDNGAS